MGSKPVTPKLFPNWGSDHLIQEQLFQVSRGEEVSDAFVLSQTHEVLLPIEGKVQRWSEGYKALLVLSRLLTGGGCWGDRADSSC